MTDDETLVVKIEAAASRLEASVLDAIRAGMQVEVAMLKAPDCDYPDRSPRVVFSVRALRPLRKGEAWHS
jgi:hypothetical protein